MRVLTFDIEEWFHILEHEETSSVETWSNYESRLQHGVELILQILEDNNARATFFCLGWVAEKYPALIRRIVNAGHEIGCHSMHHQLVFTHSKNSFGEDIRKSKELLEDVGGRKVEAFRAPGFSITDSCLWAFDELVLQGFKVDCSIFPASRAHGGLQNLTNGRPMRLHLGSDRFLDCLPMNISTFFGFRFCYSGGGYFRILPRKYIDHQINRDSYVMTYFHPRDFDVGQPVLKSLSPFRKFKSYIGISSCEGKLRYLLKNYQFCTVGEAQRSIDWGHVEQVSIAATN